jgi:hypothetical protein
MIGEIPLKLTDERPCRVRLADRNAVQPDHLAAVVFKIGNITEPLPEPRGVLLPPQKENRKEDQKCEG